MTREHQTSPSPASQRDRPGSRIVQAKLQVSTPGDMYEQEADQMADAVTQDAPAGSEDSTPQLNEEGEGEGSGEATVENHQADPQAIHESYRATTLKRPGEALPPDLRALLEPRFGFDFSRVRVHYDSRSAAEAHGLQARAYTIGSDIVFGPNEYAPHTDVGRWLIAHELSHVIQQSEARNQGKRVARQGITTPLPATAKKKKTGEAVLTVGTTGVKILPDQTGKVVDDFAAMTNFNLTHHYPYRFDLKTKVITKVKLIWAMTIQTIYKAGADPNGPSGYGRGTTDEDKKAGTTTLRFHEGSHGTDYLHYLENNALPKLALQKGAKVSDLLTAGKELGKEATNYTTAMGAYSKEQTDCVGTKAPFC